MPMASLVGMSLIEEGGGGCKMLFDMGGWGGGIEGIDSFSMAVR